MTKKLEKFLADFVSDNQLSLHLTSPMIVSKPKLVEEIDGFEPNRDLIFIKWVVAHTLPIINRNGLGISLISAELSAKSFLMKSVNLEHKVVKNLPQGIVLPTDDNGNPISLHIGHVVDVEVEGPFENMSLAVPESAREIRMTTALFRQEAIVQAIHDDILDAEVSGRSPFFQASVEYGPAGSVMDNLIFDGEKLISPEDAPDELRDLFFDFDRKPIQFRGRAAGLVVGGNNGINGSGLGLTVNPADIDTRPLEVAASTAFPVKDAGSWLGQCLALAGNQGETSMFNEKALDFLCNAGFMKLEDVSKAKAALAILSGSEASNKSAEEITEAINSLSSVMEKVQGFDIEAAVNTKLKEALESGDYIKKEDLDTKVQEALNAQIKSGDLFKKDDLDKKVQENIDLLNARQAKVVEFTNKLKENDIDIEKLDGALKTAGQELTVQEQLSSMAESEDADTKFEKSLGLWKLLNAGATGDTVNTDGGSSPTPKFASSVPADADAAYLMNNMM